MAENTKRSLWGLHGIPAMVISVVLLLAILVFLQLAVVVSYRYGAVAPYDEAPLRDINNLKMIDDRDTQRQYAFQAPKSEEK